MNRVPFHYAPNGFDPKNRSLYRDVKGISGIYIYGLKLQLEGNFRFIPLYVGIHKDLEARLWQHYCEEKEGGNSKKELFNLSSLRKMADVAALYADMAIYDKYKGKSVERYKIPSLIWFNDPEFFKYKLATPKKMSIYRANDGHQFSIVHNGDLDMLAQQGYEAAHTLKCDIMASKRLFTNHFCFAYATLDEICGNINNKNELAKHAAAYKSEKNWLIGRKRGPGKYIAERCELATKMALKEIGIHTTAKADGDHIVMQIDLDEIRQYLFCVPQ